MPFLLSTAFLMLAFLVIGLKIEDPRFHPLGKTMSTALILVLVASTAFWLPHLVASSRYGRTEERIAWTSLAGAPGEPLTLGGASGLVGWPGGPQFPEVSFTPEPGGVVVTPRGGTAFLSARDTGAILSGIDLKTNGPPLVMGQDYPHTLILENHWYWWRIHLKVYAGALPAGAPLDTVKFRAPSRWTSRPKILSLSSLLQKTIANLRVSHREPEALALERWSENITLLVERSGAVHILDRFEAAQDPASSVLKTPASFTLYGSRRAVSFDLRMRQGSLCVDFRPPFAHSSPMPPQPAEGRDRTILLTSTPLPGDVAFDLPFGERAVDPRTYWSLPNALPEVPKNPRLQGMAGKVVGTMSFPVLAETGPERVNVTLSLLRSRPETDSLRRVILLGLIGLLGGAWLIRHFSVRHFWASTGLAAGVWSLLSVRLLLALRYAADPGNLDVLAVRGLAESAAALLYLPGILLLAAGIHAQRRDKRVRRQHLWMVLGLILAMAVSSAWAHGLPFRLWPGLPERFASSTGLWALWISAFFLMLHAAVVSGGLHEKLGLFKMICYSPIYFMQDIFRNAKAFWDKGVLGWNVYGAMAVLLILLAVFTWLASGQMKIMEELVVPILFLWVPAMHWLATLGLDERRILLSGKDLLGFWGLRFLFPALVPLAIMDIGSIFAILSVFVPLGVLMIFLRPRGRYVHAVWGYMGAIALCGFSLFYVGAKHSEWLQGIGFARPRIITWSDETKAKQQLLYSEVSRPGWSVFHGVQEYDLKNTIEHTWENQAMAHEGGMDGAGFGKGPSRASHVRQDTLQYDSVFSFFILGDYGLWGGVALLILYAFPLLLVLQSARRHFDLGHAVAALLASYLFLQALLQASMNLGILPFTGRNLPLLSTNSFSNLLVWACLLSFLAQALAWRIDPESDAMDLEDSFHSEWPVICETVDSTRPTPIPPSRLLLASLALAALPVGLATAVVWRNRALVRNTSIHVLDWGILTGEMEKFIGSGVDRTKEDPGPGPQVVWTIPEAGHAYRLELVNGEGISPYSRICQEIAYFNAMPLDEQLTGARLNRVSPLKGPDGSERTLQDWAREVRAPQDFQDLLHAFQESDQERPMPYRPALFTMHRSRDIENGEEVPGVRLHLDTRSFPPRRTMSRGADSASGIPVIAWSTGGGRDPAPLVGPAWVRGSWISAFSSDFPWAKTIAQVAGTEEGRKVFPSGSAQHLSLDPDLQTNAQAFLVRRGKDLHAEFLGKPGIQRLLKQDIENRLFEIKPHRVGLTVLDLPTGKVLALSGWPVANPRDHWVQRDGEWIPPVRWVETSAPTGLASVYRGDRNFDRLTMGSSTKPLWATVALKLHPGLDKNLQTRSNDCEGNLESNVFGIDLGKAWEGPHPQTKAWCSFTDYLKYSDNRYQVRLGFLTLAETPGGSIKVQPDQGSSEERINGQEMALPVFPPPLSFSKHARNLYGLQDTPLAKKLQELFEISTLSEKGGNQRNPYLVSFWTGREQDDMQRGSEVSAFDVVSPDATNWELDLRSSRQGSVNENGPDRGPRALINLLLGGSSNTWSNIAAASSFATVVTGQPMVAHILEGQSTEFVRKPFPVDTPILRGLSGVCEPAGTAYRPFEGAAPSLLERFKKRGLRVYAKTGTLPMEVQAERRQNLLIQTSRIMLAIVKWKGGREGGTVEQGLVLSVFAERVPAESGRATTWAAEFLLENESAVLKHLGVEGAQGGGISGSLGPNPAMKLHRQTKRTHR